MPYQRNRAGIERCVCLCVCVCVCLSESYFICLLSIIINIFSLQYSKSSSSRTYATHSKYHFSARFPFYIFIFLIFVCLFICCLFGRFAFFFIPHPWYIHRLFCAACHCHIPSKCTLQFRKFLFTSFVLFCEFLCAKTHVDFCFFVFFLRTLFMCEIQ